jgi:MFS transporter, DHA1 family, multidrug resistance protein
VAVLFALTSTVETLGMGHFQAFTPIFLDQLGVAAVDIPAWTGYLAAAGFIIGLPLAPFWGVWADKYSRKVIIVRSAYIEALIFFVAALSINVWQLLAARILTGFILGNTGVMYAVISFITPRKNLGLAISSVTMGSALGLSLGPAFGGFLVDSIGVGGMFAVDGVLSILTALMLTFLFDEPESPKDRSRTVGQMLLALPGYVLAVPTVFKLFIVYFLVLVGVQMSAPFVPLLIQELYQGPGLATVIGLMFTGFGVATGVATPFWGRLGDKAGYLRILAFAIALTAISLGIQMIIADLPQLFVARFAQGIFQAALAPIIVAMVALNLPEEQRASVLNLTLFPLYFAFLVAPTIGGFLAGQNLRAVFLVSAAVMLLAFPFLPWKESRKKLPAAESE